MKMKLKDALDKINREYYAERRRKAKIRYNKYYKDKRAEEIMRRPPKRCAIEGCNNVVKGRNNTKYCSETCRAIAKAQYGKNKFVKTLMIEHAKHWYRAGGW